MSSNNCRQRSWWAAGLVAGGMLVSLAGCGHTVIENEDSRMAIDALYTAVTSHRSELVDSCEHRLQELESAGELPAATARQLADIIATARQNQWQPAAERLDALIRRIAP